MCSTANFDFYILLSSPAHAGSVAEVEPEYRDAAADPQSAPSVRLSQSVGRRELLGFGATEVCVGRAHARRLAVVGDLESLAAVLTSRPGGSAVIRGPAWWRRSVLEVVLGVAAYGFAVEPLAADR